jgi:hypothetical protein
MKDIFIIYDERLNMDMEPRLNPSRNVVYIAHAPPTSIKLLESGAL